MAIDPLYGSGRPLFLSDFKIDYRLSKDEIEKPLIDRLTLHAYQIELPDSRLLSSVIPAEAGIHPNRPHQRPDCFIAGLDKKFAATLKMLTKHNPKGLDAFTNRDNFSKIINTQRLY